MQSVQEATYALVTRRVPGEGVGLLSINVDGERAVCVFESTDKADAGDAAEVFAELGSHKPGWQVVEGSHDELILLLGLAARHHEYLVLNPPRAFTDGPVEQVTLIPIRRFIEG